MLRNNELGDGDETRCEVSPGEQTPQFPTRISDGRDASGVGLGAPADELAPAISEEVVRAWRSDASCIHCGRPVTSPEAAALLVEPNGVAHRASCFIPALIQANPLIKLLAARRSAQEVTIGRLERRDKNSSAAPAQDASEAA